MQLKKPTGSGKSGSKRTGRTRSVGELMGKLIDPALRKRGFASRDILENWRVIAPAPYNRTTMPDRLKWSRNRAGAEGAILYLRCRQGDMMALSYDHERIREAVNRYFGYVLVEAVKLSSQPFPRSGQTEENPDHKNITGMNLPAEINSRIEDTVENVADDEMKSALRQLGRGIFIKNGKNTP